tara:strand:+ start:656 stop:889 length:234 start_codon:yes stop_codon:yes gene_type:complete
MSATALNARSNCAKSHACGNALDLASLGVPLVCSAKSVDANVLVDVSDVWVVFVMNPCMGASYSGIQNQVRFDEMLM